LKHLSIDIETYSSADLKKCGVYKYAESPDFEITRFAYSVDGGEVSVVDLLSGETIPPEILDALADPNIQKWAHNAAFERVCLSRHLGVAFLPPQSWRCTMIWAAFLGMPLALESVGAVLELAEQKLGGKDLIRYFCTPCKPTKVNGGRTRNLPEHAPDKWAAFKEYNARDVAVEVAIQERLAKFPVPEGIWGEYHIDQEINDRGVALDMTFVKSAIAVDSRSQTELLRQMREITELDNPNSVQQLTAWFADNGLKMKSLEKDAVTEALRAKPHEPLRTVLVLRQQLAKSSVKKYTAMKNAVCSDGRFRGAFQFYGANRTGRWAGRLVQLQNLPRNNIKTLELARDLVRDRDYETLEILYDSVPDILSQLIRTAFVPKDGCKLVVADFAAIEAIVLAWFAKEQWVLDAYAAKDDLYVKNAERMFNAPKGSVNKNSPLRQRAKVATLACGYGGSVGAMLNMGALEQGLAEDELQPLVNAWRAANPKIVQFWWEVERAAMKAVRDRTTTMTHGIKFICQSGMLFIQLPSGRRLAYVKPRIGLNQFDRDCVEYMGVADNKKWERIKTYGAKIVENVVQATSRDLLSHAMQTLRHCEIVAHIHDELVLECDHGVSVKEICEQMSRTTAWADGLAVRVEGFQCSFYQKD
jgi:DNA polymerase